MGAVESATRAMVSELGVLSSRDRVSAESALALARALDGEPDGTKAAALSRELRLVVGSLAPGTGAVVAGDPVQRLQDEVARKRAEKAAG